MAAGGFLILPKASGVTERSVLTLKSLGTGFLLPLVAAHVTANLPTMMHLFPKERFGQICAAAMCVSAGIVIGGCLDLARNLFCVTAENH